jgi:hypothetical protein
MIRVEYAASFLKNKNKCAARKPAVPVLKLLDYCTFPMF